MAGREGNLKESKVLRQFRPAVMMTHTDFQTGVESVKIRRNLLLRKNCVLQTARVECILKRAEDRAASSAAKNALRASRLLRKLGNHCMISVKIRRKSLVYIGLILQMLEPNPRYNWTGNVRNP